MKTANVTNPSNVLQEIKGFNTKTPSIGRPKGSKKPKPTPTAFMHQTSDFSAVHYKPPESWETKIKRENLVQEVD